MMPLNVVLNIKKISVKEIQRNNRLLLSSDIRGDYILEPLAYSIHHIGVLLVEIFESPLD